jgi:hypothetical protein
MAARGEDLHLVVGDTNLNAVTVELELVNPSSTFGCTLHS